MASPEQQYQDTIARLSAHAGALDPAAVQTALGAGGTLSNSFGFNSGNDVMGLTPDQVNQLIENRGKVINQTLATVKGAADAVDQITGKSAATEMQRQAAAQQFTQSSENVRADKSLAQTKAMHDETLTQQAGIHADTLKQADEHFKSSEARHSQEFESHMGMLGKELDLKRQEIGVHLKKLSLEERRQHYTEGFGYYKGAEQAALSKLQSMEQAATSKATPDSQRPSAQFKVNAEKLMYTPQPGTVIDVPTYMLSSSGAEQYINLKSLPKPTTKIIQDQKGDLFGYYGPDKDGNPLLSAKPLKVNPYKDLHKYRAIYGGFGTGTGEGKPVYAPAAPGGE